MVPLFHEKTRPFSSLYSFYVCETVLILHFSNFNFLRWQVFVDPKKFVGVASVADAVEYLHSGRSVGKVRWFLQAQWWTCFCCSKATCNFHCYLSRSLFAWIHPMARPLLSYNWYFGACGLQFQQKIILQILFCLEEPLLFANKLYTVYWWAELRRMFGLGGT